MGGGLMQLVAYGSQDIYLTGNPQITFFKFLYKRHTNFVCESIEHIFEGHIDFGKRFNSPLTLAEQNFITPNASMNGLLNFKSLMGKF